MAFYFGLVIMLVCVAGVLSISEGNRQKAKDASNKCLKDPSNKIEGIDEQKIRNNDLANGTRPIQCYIECVNEASGLTKAGVLQEPIAFDALKDDAGFTPDIIKERIAKCSKLNKGDKCEAGYSIAMCLNEKPIPK